MKSSVVGETVAVIDYGTYTQKYICTANFTGWNNGSALVDNNGNDISGTNDGGITMYTCNVISGSVSVVPKLSNKLLIIGTPKITAPNNNIQIILAIGCFPKSVLASLPNGVNTNLASLKHCFPNGIPINVIQKITPEKT